MLGLDGSIGKLGKQTPTLSTNRRLWWFSKKSPSGYPSQALIDERVAFWTGFKCPTRQRGRSPHVSTFNLFISSHFPHFFFKGKEQLVFLKSCLFSGRYFLIFMAIPWDKSYSDFIAVKTDISKRLNDSTNGRQVATWELHLWTSCSPAQIFSSVILILLLALSPSLLCPSTAVRRHPHSCVWPFYHY